MNKDLGRKVTFSKIIKKNRIDQGCEWLEENVDLTEGIIVGKRTVMTGQYRSVEVTTEFQRRTRFIPTIRHSVYLVVRNMKSCKPVRVPIEYVNISESTNGWFN